MTKRKDPSQKKKPGRKPKEPSPEDRAFVRGMSLAGLTLEQICTEMRMSDKTLTKHFSAELGSGSTKLLAAAATNTARLVYGAKAEFDSAGNEVRAEVKPDLQACMYVLRTKGKKYGWSERVEITGPDGIPLTAFAYALDGLNIDAYSDAELFQLIALLNKGGLPITIRGGSPPALTGPGA